MLKASLRDSRPRSADLDDSSVSQPGSRFYNYSNLQAPEIFKEVEFGAFFSLQLSANFSNQSDITTKS